MSQEQVGAVNLSLHSMAPLVVGVRSRMAQKRAYQMQRSSLNRVFLWKMKTTVLSVGP